MRWALVFVVAAGCAQSLAATQPRTHAPVRTPQLLAVPGESMSYAVKLRGMVVGHTEVAVGQLGVVDGKRELVVRSHASGGGIVSLFSDLTWDLTTVLSLDDGHAVSEDSTIDMSMYGNHEHDHETDAGEHNLHETAGAIRAWQSRLGDHAAFEVALADLDLELELCDASRDTIGNMPAVRYDGTVTAANTYKVSLWLSDDAARVPLRLVSESKWGMIEVDLTSYDVATP